MIDNYDAKLILLFVRNKNHCPACGEYTEPFDSHDLHHKLRNTKGNRENYPLLIDSVLNLQAVPHECHIGKHGQCGKMTKLEADKIESYLRDNPEIAAWVNCPDNNDFTLEQIEEDINCSDK